MPILHATEQRVVNIIGASENIKQCEEEGLQGVAADE